MLSVATAPVDARQRLAAVVLAGLLAAACFAVLPLAGSALPVSPGAVPFLLGIAAAANIVTAYLLFSQFLASRLLATALLGGAYVVGAVGILGFLVTFSAASGSGSMAQAASWIWIAWHVEFPLAVVLALWFDRQKRYVDDANRATQWAGGLFAASLAVAFVPIGLIVGSAQALPVLVSSDGYIGFWRSPAGELIVLVNLLALVLAVGWTRGRTVLHTWLIVALVAAILDVQASLAGGAWYSLGWYLSGGLAVCTSAAVLYAYLRQMHVLFAKLSDLSMIDGLTELPNRRYFEMRLHTAIRTAHRAEVPLAVVVADVDSFKQYNDSYGHIAGDDALKAVASALRIAAMRPGDVIARWGGEEFVAYLPETDREGAYLVAERLRTAVSALAIPHRATPVPGGIVTITIGVTLLGGRDDTIVHLLERADTALYRAKNGGRNRVAIELAPPPASPSTSALDALFEGVEAD